MSDLSYVVQTQDPDGSWRDYRFPPDFPRHGGRVARFETKRTALNHARALWAQQRAYAILCTGNAEQARPVRVAVLQTRLVEHSYRDVYLHCNVYLYSITIRSATPRGSR